MLADPKIDRFTESFPRQWLQLHRVGAFPPDAGLYPDYDKWLEQSMVLETTGYFGEVFSQNLPLREFLVSDWTMLNPRLAMHYGLPRPAASGLQRVTLRPEDHRGGLLTQASILSLTSDGTRHRPVHRGVWVSEADLRPHSAASAAERRTARADARATSRRPRSACNSKRTPRTPSAPRAITRSIRSASRSTTSTPSAAGERANKWPADRATIRRSTPAASCRTVVAYNGSDEFKRLLAQDVDRFAEAFVEQLATYALRRVMTIDDAAQIKAIAAASKKDDYKLRTVIENLVLSDLFRKR